MRLKQIENKAKKVNEINKNLNSSSMLPRIYGESDTYDKQQLQGTLLTKQRFDTDFNNITSKPAWEDSKYVDNLSEYSKQDLL